MIQARSLTSVMLTFKGLSQEGCYELLRPCYKVKKKRSKIKAMLWLHQGVVCTWTCPWLHVCWVGLARPVALGVVNVA